MYLAIIACLLIPLYTGGQPKKRTCEMICFYLLGWASLEELDAHIKNLKAKEVEEYCATTEPMLRVASAAAPRPAHPSD